MGKEEEPEKEVRLQDMNISNFIPTHDEKIVRCQLCGGENHRGLSNCVHCGYMIKQSTQREEIIEEDDVIVSRIPPSKLHMYRTMGIQLYIYKLINKFRYNCQTKYKYPDGRVETCGQPLTFIHDTCPKCKEKKQIYYNCTNYDDPKIKCDQLIDVSMLVCPKCQAPTLYSDILSIVTGNSIDNEAIKFTYRYLQRDFPKFVLVQDNYKIVITHQKLMQAKWWLQRTSLSVSEMLKMLAIFIGAVMTRGGKPSMPSILTSFNLAKTLSQIRSPQESDGLAELIHARENEVENELGNQPAPAPATPDDGDDADNSEFIV